VFILLEFTRYPTIYWMPGGGKPQKYEVCFVFIYWCCGYVSSQGGREVSDFISFIKKNATNKPVVVSGEEEKKKKKKKKSEEL
jgi:protein disulfide isomerase family A protein 3